MIYKSEQRHQSRPYCGVRRREPRRPEETRACLSRPLGCLPSQSPSPGIMLGAAQRACSTILKAAKPAVVSKGLQNVGSKTLPALYTSRELLKVQVLWDFRKNFGMCCRYPPVLPVGDGGRPIIRLGEIKVKDRCLARKT